MATKPKTQQRQAPKPAPKKTEEKKPQVPATIDKGNTAVAEYDEEMLKAMGGDAGRGVSTRAEDVIVPLIYILQSQSPQALRQKAEYIDGAIAGNFWYRGTKTVVDGDEGMPVVLCHMSTKWIEWAVERGPGSLRGRYDKKPSDAQWEPDPKDPRTGKWMMPSGDTYVAETKEMVVICVETGDAYVLPCSGSNIGTARAWNTACGRKRVPSTDAKSPLWGYVWRLKTVAKSNDKGDWFGLAFEEETDGEEQILTWSLDGGKLYKAARQLNADFEAGLKQSDQGEELYDDDTASTSEEQEDEHV